MVPMYFAREREMVVREHADPARGPSSRLWPGEKPQQVMCRFRTLGCSPCTGAIRSDADTIEKVIEELMTARQSERITRVIDHDQEGSMELKKREGYFSDGPTSSTRTSARTSCASSPPARSTTASRR